MTVSKATQTQAYIETGFYISSGKRCCKTHITGLVFNELALEALGVRIHQCMKNTRAIRKETSVDELKKN